MTLKEKIFQTFLERLDNKVGTFQANLNDLRESVMNETKSTAGDKHETALAMLQREQSQIAKHLYEAIEDRKIFFHLKINENNSVAKTGSLIKTNYGFFFISVALPKIIVEDLAILAISPKSPLGMQLMGRKQGERITVNEKVHIIEFIL